MKKKILFVNDEMTMGGVARILNTFLKMIDRDKYDVDLLVLHKRGELLSEIPEGINVIAGTSFFDTIDFSLFSDENFSKFNKLRLLFYMKTGLIKKKIVEERKKMLTKHYDVEFSAKEGFCTIFTAFGDSDIKLNWVQVDYKESNYSKNHMKLVKEALERIDYNIACSNTVKESYKEIFGVERIGVIHNLIDEEKIRNMSFAEDEDVIKESDKINLITVARFHHQKGLDRLIRVYSKLTDYYNLYVIGDGELRDELHTLAKECGCYELIKWMGMQRNPYPYVRKSDLFVMSSVYEGYPTITIETLLSDTPILTTSVAGVGEQIIKPECGFIVENSEKGLYDKLFELKDKKDLLVDYKKKLEEYHYENDQILSSYYSLFEKGNRND